MKTSVIGFLVFAMAGTNAGAQGPDPELGKLKGMWFASGVWDNGKLKMDRYECHFPSMLIFDGKNNAEFLGGQLGVPGGFDWRGNMKVRALPKQKQLVFSFAANETKGKQKAAVSCGYTLKEGDTTDELILNFGEGADKWTFFREKPKKTAPAPQPPAKEIEKKIKSLQDQIDELRKQQEALIKEREQLAQSEAEQAKRFAKVEIRGKLVKMPPSGKPSPWQVAINELVLPVNFNDGKLQALAEQYAGKEVVITGSIVFGIEMVPGKYESPVDFDRFITVRIESLKLAEK